MIYLTWPTSVALGLGFFLIGTVVGSFLNVCIYRIPWQKSVIWPGSRCTRCWSAISARDNIPIVSWIALRGECRQCGEPIAIRYPMIEALVGLLFLGAYVLDVATGPGGGSWVAADRLIAAAYHATFLALLVVATFIDYDLMIIPREITLIGLVFAIGMGTIYPGIRPLPAVAMTHLQGFGVGLVGFLVGAGLTQFVRLSAGFILRREAMGIGDVDLLGMIGAFMGWQAAVLAFFFSSFFGIVHAAWKLIAYVQKRLRGGQLSSSDREMPLGPYLSMAAASLLFVWPVFWVKWAATYFRTLAMIFWWLLGVNVPDPG